MVHLRIDQCRLGHHVGGLLGVSEWVNGVSESASEQT